MDLHLQKVYSQNKPVTSLQLARMQYAHTITTAEQVGISVEKTISTRLRRDSILSWSHMV